MHEDITKVPVTAIGDHVLKCALDISSDTGVRGPQNSFVIKKAFSCQTSGLVYCISCRGCPALYIGETGRTLRQRFGEHLRSIEKSLLGYPVAEHFNTAGHSIDDALVRRFGFGFGCSL